MADAHDLGAGAGKVLAVITPHPHRGDLIAAGAVPLALGVLLVNVRLDAEWGVGILLVLTALAAALVLGMGLLAPLEDGRPRAYQQVLLIAGLLLGFSALVHVAQVLGADDPLGEAGSRMWIFTLVAVGATVATRARRSAVCALIAALAAIVATLAFVDWAFDPDGPAAMRWVLLGLAVVFVLAALARRDVQRRESVYLIDAAGVAMLALGLTFLGAAVLAYTPVPNAALAFFGIPAGVPGGGWKLVLLAAGLGLVAYAGVDQEPGPGYLGTLVLLVFVALVGIPAADGASLWFWPLALLIVGAAAVAAGLRPRRPLPPEPSGRPAEPVPGPGAAGGPRSGGSLWATERPTGDERPGQS